MSLLDGVLVVDAAGEPAAMAGRLLADLGARVVKVGFAHRAWDHGCERRPEAGAGLLGEADVVIVTPGRADAPSLAREDAPGAVWVSVTPFGAEGPRAHWRASDLGVMAASGNMWATGDPDRPPVRCTQPSGYAHVGAETVVAALTGLASGRPVTVDVSMQEVVLVASMGAPVRFAKTGDRGQRRGADIGRTREIWPCRDGFVSFGIRGGKARLHSLQTIAALAGLPERDWSGFSHTTAPDDELAEIEEAVGRYFAAHSVAELDAVAAETGLMLAPVNSAKEIYASAQLAARDFFDEEGRPRSAVKVRHPEATPAEPPPWRPGPRAWSGTKLVEFGSGAAGPVVARYFAEHGATVVRVESKGRPDFLRVYALGPHNPHGLEGSLMFDVLNVGKLGVTLDLKHPAAVEVAKRLVGWADGVVENFAPRAMKGFGLDYDSLVADRPDLVMLSSCLNGQNGPRKDDAGFGSQGSALCGYTYLTGWPDRAPVGPFGTITDSLAPRFAAAALAAALLYRRRTGRGVHLDVSQVETAVWSLTPWLLDHRLDGVLGERDGNRHPGSATVWPHGAFPAAGHDRWVAVACWDDDERERLGDLMGLGPLPADLDDAEAVVAAWTRERPALETAEVLQEAGIEAVPVQDFGDVFSDPQLAHRGHFVTLEHPVMGEGPYERNGFRVLEADGGYDRTSPTLGEHTLAVLGGLLGMSEREINELQRSGALE